MKIQVLFLTARSCVLEIPDGGLYETLIPWEIWLNGKYYMTTRKVITNLFGLKPDTDYRVEVSAGAGVMILLLRQRDGQRHKQPP